MEAPNFYQSRRPRLAQAKRSSPFKSAPQVAAKKKKPSESPAPKKASKVRLVKKKAAITLKLLPEQASMMSALETAESERASMMSALQTAESEQASMMLALQTAESERSSSRLILETLSQRLSNIERGTPPSQQEQLDTSPYQTRRRLFGYHVGEADPQPLEPEATTSFTPILVLAATPLPPVIPVPVALTSSDDDVDTLQESMSSEEDSESQEDIDMDCSNDPFGNGVNGDMDRPLVATAIYLLLQEEVSFEEVNKADEMPLEFVIRFQALFGRLP
ncbi:hypothetical protein KUCAC02_037260 [Chaenocephalus aceratus]|nr:hypothetical protein KUCAC02_037260 [Chaenocephalus aceratus]